jgi:hypothetical protein
MDDYLAEDLSQRDRHLLEAHLSRCSRCAVELRSRPALERRIRRALAASVQPLSLSPEATTRIIAAAEESLQRSRRSRRAIRSLHLVAAAVAACLFVVGVLFLAGEIPVPAQFQPVALLPANRLWLADPDAVALSPGREPTPLTEESSARTLPKTSLLFEPRDMHPREPFTMTVLLQSDLPRSIDSVRLDLDVSGPTGYYRFGLAVKGPLPARGVSILRLTPELLEETCEEQYLMAPTDVFSVAGTYSVRLTLFDVVVDPH